MHQHTVLQLATGSSPRCERVSLLIIFVNLLRTSFKLLLSCFLLVLFVAMLTGFLGHTGTTTFGRLCDEGVWGIPLSLYRVKCLKHFSFKVERSPLLCSASIERQFDLCKLGLCYTSKTRKRVLPV